MKLTALLSTGVLLSLLGAAQDTAFSALDPVTVTANLSPTQRSKTGRNLQILKGEQFYNLPVNSVDELLRYIPGVEIQARGPMGAQADILIRGGTFQQVLVILDGVRLNDPLTGHFSAYIPIAPGEIDRIEVLKGAASAIYGTEAVGGVVHIITKTFAASSTQSQIQAQVTGGEYGLVNLSGGANIVSSHTKVGLGVQSNHAQGQPQRGTRGFFDNTTLSASVQHRLSSQWQAGARVAYDYRDFSAQNYYTTFASDTAEERVKTWWTQAFASYQGKGWQWQLNAGYKATDDRFAFNKTSAPNQNNSQVWQALSTATIPFKQGSLVTGLQYIQKTIKSNDRGQHAVSQTAAFATLNWQASANLTLNPAMRFDYNQRGGFEWVPQLNAAYKAGPLQFRGSIGRTIRDADFTERFNNYNRSLVTSGRIGNPDLQAERSWSYELGADVLVSKSFKISTGWFGRWQQKLIDWVTTPYAQMPRKDNLVPTGTYALASNISRVNTRGAEVDMQWEHQFANAQKLVANMGLVWIKSTTPAGTDPGFYLNAHARFLTNFSLQYQYKGLQLSLNGLYKERNAQKATPINAEITKNYLVVNTRLQMAVYKGLSAYVQIDNVGNTRYADLLGCPMPRRWLMGGVSFKTKR